MARSFVRDTKTKMGNATTSKEIAHRIAFESQGLVTSVRTLIVDGDAVCNHLSTTRAAVEEAYRRAWQ